LDNKNGNGWFIKFYSPTCSHCKALAPTWTSFADLYSSEVNVGEVDCIQEHALCGKYNISSVPTLLYFPPFENFHFHKFDGDRTIEEFVAFSTEPHQ
jgi:protein disulfide-isomerase